MARETTVSPFSVRDAEAVLSIRLLIARAANKDSLAWWDDESLSSQGAFLMDRIFPVAPRAAARSLALRAALSRHQAACAAEPQAIHLFRLDVANRDELALRQVPLASLPVPEEPISTVDELRLEITRLTGGTRPYRRVRVTGNQGLLIEVPSPPAGMSLWQHRAETLAYAYLEGTPGRPVFPYTLV